jgi:zinc/manganese transport system substrate-binding protein
MPTDTHRLVSSAPFRPLRVLSALLLFTVSATAGFAAAPLLPVVTLNTVLTEIAREVGGDHVRVTGLLQPGVDPHGFEPTPADIRAATQAEVIFASGLHLEAYLEHIVANAGAAHRIVLVGDALPRLLKLSAEHAHHPTPAGGPEKCAGETDPHWWHSIDNVLFATELIRVEFTRLRPALADHFARNAEAYRQRLLSLKVWADQEITQLTPSRRLLYTSHDAFGYLARDYGFTVYAIHGLSTDGEPNAKHIAGLIDLIRAKKVKAIFAESSVNPRLITQLVAETGAGLGGTLYADGLGAANSPATTYEALVRHNLSTIIKALK